MKRIVLMVALLVGATFGMNATFITETNIRTEVNQSRASALGYIDAYINAGANSVRVTVPNGSVVGVMPGMLQWSGGSSTITVTNLNRMFDTSTPGTSFTFDIGVRIDGMPIQNGVSGIYTVTVHVQ